MTYGAKIILDSMNVETGDRITTIEATIPKWLQAELNTHKDLSRNSASSRAIPAKKTIEEILKNPVMPLYWGKNQKGMQAGNEIHPDDQERAKRVWLKARDQAVASAEQLEALGVHKQITNRLIEPFLFTTVLITATNWNNFFHQRPHKDAQPEIQYPAKIMLDLYRNNLPNPLFPGRWHLPYIKDDEYDNFPIGTLRKVSAARCARVSYNKANGTPPNVYADLELFDRLVERNSIENPQHLSPLEHQAEAQKTSKRYANMVGWKLFRTYIEEEYGYQEEIAKYINLPTVDPIY